MFSYVLLRFCPINVTKSCTNMNSVKTEQFLLKLYSLLSILDSIDKNVTISRTKGTLAPQEKRLRTEHSICKLRPYTSIPISLISFIDRISIV